MSTIAELALNFDLSGANARFLDPPARLFSILDFKNRDDTNRWGDTSEVSTNLSPFMIDHASESSTNLVPSINRTSI